MKILAAAAFAFLLLSAPAFSEKPTAKPAASMGEPAPAAQPSDKKDVAPKQKYATAIFAGGCFWCMESDFDDVKGVVDTTSGYTGGTLDEPTYEQVSKGNTGHRESLKVTYDPTMVSYDDLLKVFWQNIDPFDNEGQFCDKGTQYRAAIFYITREEEEKAIASAKAVEAKFGKHIATAILPASRFWFAEDDHQNYHEKNDYGYKFYRTACGRDSRLEELWGPKKKE